jgi:hypothetical protein
MSPDLPTQLPAHVDNVPLALKGQHVNHKRTTAWISPTPRASNTKIRTLPGAKHLIAALPPKFFTQLGLVSLVATHQHLQRST